MTKKLTAKRNKRPIGGHTPEASARANARKTTSGKLARVNIVPPAVRPKDVDLKAVRKAVRDYFSKHPKALERT